MTQGTRVQLTPEARAEAWKYGDIGTRLGTVRRVETGWVIVQWDRIERPARMPQSDVELIL